MGYVPDQSMNRLLWAGKCGLWAFGVFTSSTALAQTGAQLPLLVGTGATGVSFSVPVQTLLFFTALSFLPAILLMMTGFTRIVIVLSLMRQALGTQSSPPNQVIVGLSLFLTFFVMGPTLDKVYADAYLPYTKNAITFEQALQKRRGSVASVHGKTDPASGPFTIRQIGQTGARRHGSNSTDANFGTCFRHQRTQVCIPDWIHGFHSVSGD